MTKTFRVGIAGYGVVGRRRHQFIDDHPLLETVAVSDIKLDNQRSINGIKIYTDYKNLFKENLDILFVSLPNYLAPIATIAGLENNCHVFCEKPPGRNVNDVLEVQSVEKQFPKAKLKYGFNHRYHDSVGEAMKLIKSGKLGDLINLRGVYGKSSIVPFLKGQWRSMKNFSGGGILLDQGVHMLDMFRYFCGDFQEVKSFVSNNYWGHDPPERFFYGVAFLL